MERTLYLQSPESQSHERPMDEGVPSGVLRLKCPDEIRATSHPSLAVGVGGRGRRQRGPIRVWHGDMVGYRCRRVSPGQHRRVLVRVCSLADAGQLKRT